MKTSLSTFLLVTLLSAGALASPDSLFYQGRILDNSGNPLENSNVVFRFTLLSPDGTCELWTETKPSINMINSGGIFDLTIGPSAGLATALENGTNHTCLNSGNYTGVGTAGRNLKVEFNPGGTGWREITPNLAVSSVPYAIVAAKLGNRTAADFIARPGTCASGQSVYFDGTNFVCQALVAGDIPDIDAAKITTGTLTRDVLSTNVSATNGQFTSLRIYDGVSQFITMNYPSTGAASYTLRWPAVQGAASTVLQNDGAGNLTWAASGGSSGTVTNVTSTNSYISVATGTTTPEITANIGTTANTLAAGDDIRFVDARTPTGAAGGDLSGTYPNPAVARLQGRAVTASLPLDGQALLWDNGLTTWRPEYIRAQDLRNAWGGTQMIPTVTCAANESMTWSAITDRFTCQAIGSLNASAITAGTINTARLGSGTADGTTFLRGDGTWESIASGSGDINQNGNTFGAAVTLGTNDNFGLNLETNSQTRLAILNNGNVGIGSTAPGAMLQLGTSGTSMGTMRLTGNTSGFVQIQPAAAAGSWNMTLPANDGDPGQVLSTDGSGVTSWVTASGGASALDGLTDVITNYGAPNNMYLGSGVGATTTTGASNTGLGSLSLQAVTSGYNNSAFGNQALQNLTTGYSNVAVGRESLHSLTTANGNTAVGMYSAAGITSGSGNTAIGDGILTGVSTGSNNVAVGSNALNSLNGDNNVAFGFQAGRHATGASGYNIFLGNQSGPGSNSTISNTLWIHNWSGDPTIYGDLANRRIGLGGMTNPSSTLDINGALTQRGTADPGLSPAGQGRIYFDSTANQFRVSQNGGAYTNLLGSGNVSNGGNSLGAAMTIGTNDNFGLNFETNNSTHMTIRNDGNVGIGNSNPGAKLVVQTGGNSTAVNIESNPWQASSGDYRSLNVGTFHNGGASTATLQGIRNEILSDLNSGNVENVTGINNIAIFASGPFTGNILRGAHNLASITGSGSVNTATGSHSLVNHGSSGTTTVANALFADVAVSSGAVTNARGLFIDALQGTNRWGIYQNGASDLNYFAGNVGIGTITPTYQLQLSTDSAAKPGTSTWTIASDERLKDIRAPFTRGLAAINGLNTVYFNYKKDNSLDIPSEKEFVGIRAQDAQKVIPEAVEVDKNGFLHLTNDSIIWAAVNAIKELYIKVMSHEEENKRLKAENAAIKAYLCEKDPAAPFCD